MSHHMLAAARSLTIPLELDGYATARPMRCACQHCGAHTVTTVGHFIGGNCPNCGSYELKPICPSLTKRTPAPTW